ncbi:MAG: GNAT family N-acetyltransferase [Pseudomonadota bacterium]
MSEVLTTERLVLRRPAMHDAERATAFYMSERSRFAGGNQPEPRAWSAFAAMLGHWQIRGFGLWAVTTREADRILGMVGPYFPAGWPERELGWVLFDGAEGKGYAQEAVHAARDHAFATLGWTGAVSYIAPDNARSIALAERVGAVRDSAARPPFPDKPTLVYRHPFPENRP